MLFSAPENEVLLKRFQRYAPARHPLSRSGLGLQEASSRSSACSRRSRTRPTSRSTRPRLSVHELRELVRERVVERTGSGPSLLFQSFATATASRTTPISSFDAPRAAETRTGTRRSATAPAATSRVAGSSPAEEVARFVRGLAGFLERWLPSLVARIAATSTVAVG